MLVVLGEGGWDGMGCEGVVYAVVVWCVLCGISGCCVSLARTISRLLCQRW